MFSKCKIMKVGFTAYRVNSLHIVAKQTEKQFIPAVYKAQDNARSSNNCSNDLSWLE